MAVYISLHGLDCRKCSDQAKAEHGYYKASTIGNIWKIDGETYNRCPVTLVPSEYFSFLNLYAWFKRGVFIGGKNYEELSMKYIEIMDLIDAKVEKHNREELERAQKKHGRTNTSRNTSQAKR